MRSLGRETPVLHTGKSGKRESVLHTRKSGPKKGETDLHIKEEVAVSCPNITMISWNEHSSGILSRDTFGFIFKHFLKEVYI